MTERRKGKGKGESGRTGSRRAGKRRKEEEQEVQELEPEPEQAQEQMQVPQEPGEEGRTRQEDRGMVTAMAEREVSSKRKMEHPVSRTDEGLGG